MKISREEGLFGSYVGPEAAELGKERESESSHGRREAPVAVGEKGSLTRPEVRTTGK